MSSIATKRVIALVDMDCFYCQVETRLNPSLKGKPMAVVQYNQWKGGGIIAVNYEARDKGVSRHMRGDEAKEVCPEIVLVPVPTIRGKADLSNYRDAGDEVAKIFSEFSECVQRGSIDEAYIDLTNAVEKWTKSETSDLKPDDLCNTFVVGYCDLKNKNEGERKKGLVQWLDLIERQGSKECSDYQLAIGAKIIENMRAEILKRTGFHCSAGIAHNKILAKLAAGLHKPQRQTILPQDNVPELYQALPIYKVRNLGGKLGKLVAEKFCIKYMSELQQFTLPELQQKFDEKTSQWLYNIARGIDLEPVTSRLRPESVGCCKNFTGKNALTTRSEVEHWLKELATEISERLCKDLERYKRRAKVLTVSFCQESSMTKCGALNSYEVSRLANDALNLLKKFNHALPNEDLWTPPIKFLGLAASKFTEVSSIEKYLKNCKPPENLKTAPLQPCTSESSESVTKECSATKSPLKIVKKNESIDAIKSKTSKESVKPSFFLNFLNDKKDTDAKIEKNAKTEIENSGETVSTQTLENDDDLKEDPWISLTEVFPDVNEADAEIVQSLPEELQKKFWEKLNNVNVNMDSKEESKNWNENSKVLEETCPQCKKLVRASEVSVHMDYHAALKLYSEINRPTSNPGSINIATKKTKEVECKRKKKGRLTPPKKMKSLTSFFTPIPKK